MNAKKNITQALWSLKFQNFGISQCLEIYQKFPFFIFLSKCVEDKLSQDAWLPLPHGSSFFVILLKVRFREKNGFYFLSQLEKAKLRPELRFEAKVLQFFKIKIRRNCPEKTLISIFFPILPKCIKNKIFIRRAF